MAQPRYNDAMQRFLRQWRPNDPDLDKRFMKDMRVLLAAILAPPANTFEVETILTETGGKVVVRLGDYEAQLDPLDAQHLGISIIEGSTSARMELVVVDAVPIGAARHRKRGRRSHDRGLQALQG